MISARSDREAARMTRQGLFCVLCLLVILFALGLFDLISGDIWWHLRTGQLIRERVAVPQVDWFTYTNPNARWIDLHWGFQVITSWLWDLGGEWLLVAFKASCAVVTFAICFTISAGNSSVWHRIICWLPCILLFSSRYLVRPELFSFLFLAATLAILHHSRRHPRLLWLLPVVQVLWVNVHALFVLQYIVVGAFMVDRAWCCFRRGPNASEPSTNLTFIGLCISLPVCGLINPYGLDGLLFPLTLLEKVQGTDRSFFYSFSPELRGIASFVGEYGWIVLFDRWQFLVAVLMLSLALMASVTNLVQGRGLPGRVLLLLVFGYLAWQMQRNLSVFSIIVGTVFSLDLTELTAGQVMLRRKGSRRHLAAAFSSVVAISLLIILAAASVTGDVQRFLSRTPQRHAMDTSAWRGQDAMTFLEGDGMPDHIYAVGERLAARCIFYLGPEKRVFADARLELNSRQTLEDYLNIQFQLPAGDPAAEQTLKRYGNGQLPALAFDNMLMLNFSVDEPRLFQGLLRNPRWVCAFSTTSDDLYSGEAKDLVDGVTVFLHVTTANKLGLKAAPVSQLLTFADAYRRDRLAR